MKKCLAYCIILILSSCTREPEKQETCYSYINQTEYNVTLELYSYNSGQAVTNIGFYKVNAKGLSVKKCRNAVEIPGPVTVFQADSIVVKFNDEKRLNYFFDFREV